ncbi:MAG TPA: DUF4292 domain-containing protein [Candidatus Kapabacteria bacterium]|nr:DUF4292 domain-containing protein [Candidatus Kapabacteria bacterium]
MSSRFGNKTVISAALLGGFLAGCASAPKTTVVHPLAQSANMAAIAGIHSWLDRKSRAARSLNASGDITVDQNGESNSASFTLKSKRLDASGNRIDSLGIEVMGPFGINVARFLASPQEYKFYDILHGQTLSGPTDTHSLEALTHLQGISLEDMSDIIYGLVRIDTDANDSVKFYSDNDLHHALIIRVPGVSTTALDFEGALPTDSSSGNLTLVRYQRWNGVPESITTTPPDIAVHFAEPMRVNGVSIPQHIEANAGENKLTLEYDHVDINPSSLVVRIKMP